jgi:CubicO group peptidase (beta-lactamase class C family)
MTTTDALDAIFAEWNHDASPGCAVMVLRDGQVVEARGYGHASLEYHSPITPQTVFHVASISKQFTVFAALLLANEGRLALDDDVRHYVAEVPDFDHTITLRHLIHHTSGLRDQWELLVMAGWRWDDVMTTADILDLVSRQRELNFAPGTDFAYCNTGYTLLAEAVARVSGTSFRAFCAERIFGPLGMNATHVHDDHTEVVHGRAYSYNQRDGRWHHAVLSYANHGATSLFTTAADLARWDRNFETGAVGGPRVLAQMHEPGALADGTVLDYAGGLIVREHRGRRVVEHSGGDAGFRAHLVRFPHERLSVIVLGNAGNMNPHDRAYAVANLMLGETSESTEANTATDAAALDETTLTGFTGLFANTARSESRSIELRDMRLMLGSDPDHVLRPVAADTLQVGDNLHRRLRFVRGPEGGLREVHDTMAPLPPVVYQLVERATPTEAELAEYVGRYGSDELDVRYTVQIDEGKLGIQRRKYDVTPLAPTYKDAFTGGADVRFTRDVNGAVNGFLLTTGRVRNVRFVRLRDEREFAL